MSLITDVGRFNPTSDHGKVSPGKCYSAWFPPDLLYSKLMGDHAWTIYGNGEIDIGTDEKLKVILEANNIPNGSFLYLNSPAGSLVGGIKLGRAIREHSQRHSLVASIDI